MKKYLALAVASLLFAAAEILPANAQVVGGGGNNVSQATGILGANHGGTGVANNVAATLTRSGNHALTITTSGTTGITLPTSGTLATVAGTLPITGGTLTGNLLFTDATYDIGATGATRPRDLFLSRNAVIGGNLTVDTSTFSVDGANNAVGVGTASPSGFGTALAVVGGASQTAGGGELFWDSGNLTYIKLSTTGNRQFTISSDATTTYLQFSNTGVLTIPNLATTGSATGKTIVCADTSGVLYRSTSGVACAN